MLTAYIPLARNRDIFLRASLVLLLHHALDRVLRRVLAREHPHGGGSLLLELACLAEACRAACQAAFPGRFQLAQTCLQLCHLVGGVALGGVALGRHFLQTTALKC